MVRFLFIWIAAIILAVFSGFTAMGAVAKNKSPALSAGLKPLNGFAAENMATASTRAALVENQGAFPEEIDAPSKAWALRAFRAEPLTSAAVGILALAAPKKQRLALMEKSRQLSRREKLITGWMIAHYNQQEDVSGILAHYDTALRTDRQAYSVIMPVLARALASDFFIDEFTRILKARPPWAGDFWKRVVRTPAALPNGARLRANLLDLAKNSDDFRDDMLVAALAENGNFDEARSLYGKFAGREALAQILRGGNFAASPEYPPIDWETISVGEYGASISDDGLYLSAVPKSGGVFARQLVKLPTGILEFSALVSHSQSSAEALYVELSCADKGRKGEQKIRIKLPEKKTVQKIDNPGGCRYHWLKIMARASDNDEGFDATMNEITIAVG